MTDVINKLYPIYLDCGYSLDLFWDYSIKEIRDLIESSNRQLVSKREDETNRFKMQMYMNQLLARNIAEYFGSGDKLTAPYEMFPNMFQEEIKEQQKADLELFKARMYEYVQNNNAKHKRKEV